jgi:RNA polymerase sigma-70 factor (ECF subfamily)
METSASLLDRLRQSQDESAWRQLVAFYGPLLRGWLERYDTVHNDLDDIAQEVLLVVWRKLPQFQRERTGSFRSWLRHIAVNCVRQAWRARRGAPVAPADSAFWESLNQLEDPHSSLSRLWEGEHDRYVTQRLLEQIRDRFEPKTWTAFQRVAIDGVAPAAVAEELGITVNAVFIAKSRVLTMLRQEGEGLLD